MACEVLYIDKVETLMPFCLGGRAYNIKKELKMNRIIKTGSLGAALSLALMLQAQAVQISGDLSFSGGIGLNAPAYIATQANSFSGVTISGTPAPTDDFASFVSVGDAVTMTSSTPWVFTSAQTALWTVDGFTFDLDAGSLVTHAGSATAGTLSVIGEGTVSGHGFDPTPGVFSFSANNARKSFSFSASASAIPTPDTGCTVGLMGIGMLVIGVAKRKLGQMLS